MNSISPLVTEKLIYACSLTSAQKLKGAMKEATTLLLFIQIRAIKEN